MNVFNALDGSEYRDVIIHAIRQALDNSNQLPACLTFPLTRFEVEIRVFNIESGGSFTVVAEGAVKAQQAEPPAVVIRAAKSIAKTAPDQPDQLAPDEARAEAGLPMIEKTMAGGHFVDAPTPRNVFAEMAGQPGTRRGGSSPKVGQ